MHGCREIPKALYPLNSLRGFGPAGFVVAGRWFAMRDRQSATCIDKEIAEMFRVTVVGFSVP